MPYIAPPFTPTVTISGTDLIRNTDEKLQTIANDVGDYLEAQTQAMYTDLDGQMTVIENDYNTVLKPEIEQKMDDLLSVNPDGTYYTKSAIDTLVASKVAKVASTDNAIARFDGTAGAIKGSGVVVDDNGAFVGGQAINTAELVTNGTFDSDTSGWTAQDSTLSVSSGAMTIQAESTTSNACWVKQSIQTVIGQKYAYKFKLSSVANTSVLSVYYIRARGGNATSPVGGTSLYNKTANMSAFVAEELTVTFVADSVSTLIALGVYSDNLTAKAQLTIDNISVKEVPLTLNNLPAVATTSIGADNTLPRWDASTGAIQNSGVVIDDSDRFTNGIKLSNTAIADATTLNWNERATATLTATGMTTAPTVTCKFARIGNTVTAVMGYLSGTSNATSFTFTGVPTSFRPTTSAYTSPIAVKDNGVYSLGLGTLDASGNITLNKDFGGTLFTATGAKGTNTCTFTYIL